VLVFGRPAVLLQRGRVELRRRERVPERRGEGGYERKDELGVWGVGVGYQWHGVESQRPTVFGRRLW
jgi:hypothetical protein